MARRRVTIFLSLLAVAFNVVGAPIVSAHMSNMDHVSQSAMAGMEHCKGHATTGTSERHSSPANGHQECCKSGVCSCGCLHSAALSILAMATNSIAPESAPAETAPSVPANTVEDPLRPPIA